MKYDSFRGGEDYSKLKKRTLKEASVTTKEVFHHEESMDMMFKAIEITPMAEGMKAILRLRLSGYNIIDIQAQLWKKHILLGTSTKALEDLETEAKSLVMATLKRFSMQDIIGKANADKSKLIKIKNDLANP